MILARELLLLGQLFYSVMVDMKLMFREEKKKKRERMKRMHSEKVSTRRFSIDLGMSDIFEKIAQW